MRSQQWKSIHSFSNFLRSKKWLTKISADKQTFRQRFLPIFLSKSRKSGMKHDLLRDIITSSMSNAISHHKIVYKHTETNVNNEASTDVFQLIRLILMNPLSCSLPLQMKFHQILNAFSLQLTTDERKKNNGKQNDSRNDIVSISKMRKIFDNKRWMPAVERARDEEEVEKKIVLKRRRYRSSSWCEYNMKSHKFLKNPEATVCNLPHSVRT